MAVNLNILNRAREIDKQLQSPLELMPEQQKRKEHLLKAQQYSKETQQIVNFNPVKEFRARLRPVAKEYGKRIWRAATSPFVVAGRELIQSGKRFVSPTLKGQKITLAQSIANALDYIGGVANVAFSPVSSAFSIANEIPTLKPAAWLLSQPFAITGKIGEFSGEKFIDVLPIDKKSKDIIRPAMGRMGSLLGQVVLGARVMGEIGKRVRVGKKATIEPEKINRIVDETRRQIPVKGENSFYREVPIKIKDGHFEDQVNRVKRIIRENKAKQFSELNNEQIIEKEGGWEPGLREKFDKALMKKDKKTLKALLPRVPEEYKKRLASNIERVLGKEKPPVETKIPKELQPLAKEARKYKSAEKFSKKILDDLAEKQGKLYERGGKLYDQYVYEQYEKMIGGKAQGFKTTASEKLRNMTKKEIKLLSEKNKQNYIKEHSLDWYKEIQSGKYGDPNYMIARDYLMKEGKKIDKQQLKDFYNQAIKEAKPVETKIPKELEPYGYVKEWGIVDQYAAKNPYRKELDRMKITKKFNEDILKKADRWEMEQMLKDKPAFLSDGFLSKEEVKKFAKKHHFWIRTDKYGDLVVARDIDTLNRVLNAIDSGNPREIGLSLGYKDVLGKVIKQPVEKGIKEKLPEFPNKEKSVELQATLVPGMKEFVEKDIVPQVRGIKNFTSKLVKTLRNTFTPEANSIRARKVDAELASKIMDLEHTKQVLWKITEKQKAWFDKVPEEARYKYLDLVQKGKATKANLLKLAKGDKNVAKTLWNMIKEDRIAYDDIYKRETKLGIRMHYQNNYLPQIWRDVKKAKVFFSKYAESLGKDRFAKKKVIPLISIGRKAGLELKTSNPIELRLMRQFDGERAIMRQQFINKLVDEGIAVKYEKGMSLGDKSLVDAPNGHRYAVESDVIPLLNNAIFSPSLWSSQSIGGDIFRGISRAKNTIVSIKLSMSLFHPVHILGIDQSSRAAMALGGIIRGGLSWKEGIKELIKANTSLTQKDVIKMGIKINQAWDKPVKDLTDYETTAIKYMIEGGYSPKMSDVWRIKAIDSFKRAVREGNYPGATIRGVPALIESYQKPMFEIWIPATKTMAYLRACEIKLKEMPKLVENEAQRKIEFRKIAKMIDDRYGQLNYKTLFWKPFVKEIGIGSSLSMGWNLGFFRAFGGAGIDTVKFIGAIIKKARGEKMSVRQYVTDQMLFALDYTLRAMIVGGLITYANTGDRPKKLLDFFFPKSGEGEHRLNTPWYTREFFSLVNHWKKQGYIGGTWHYLANKVNPIIMPLVRSWKNKDYFGYEIRDENDPKLKQLEDTLKYLSQEELLPISATSYQRAKKEMPKRKAFITSFMGYTPAPRYITETPIQTKIYNIYSKRFSGGLKTKKQKEKAKIKSEIRNLYLKGKTKEADKKFQEAIQKGYVKQTTSFLKNLDLPSDIRAFRALPSADQKGLLSKMKLEDIKKYYWYAHQEVQQHLPNTPAMRQFIKIYSKLKKPVWKRQKLVK